MEAYNAFGGFQKGYPQMKKLLLEWHRNREMHGSRRWRSELKNLRMKPGESFKLLAMRTQEVARKAYPLDDVECVKKMLEAFYRVTPTWFNDKLRHRQEVKEMTGLGRKLTWSDILKQSEREDKSARERVQRSGGSSNASPHCEEEGVWIGYGAIPGNTPETVKRDSTNYNPRTFWNRSPPRQNVGPRQRQRADAGTGNIPENSGASCDWCGKPRHSVANCWLKNGACLICGDLSHQRRECPRYSNGSPIRCPLCKGPHLGMHCRARRNSETFESKTLNSKNLAMEAMDQKN